jgi:hypothetical protein
MRKRIAISMLVLLSCLLAAGQSGFDPDTYGRYLKANQDLTYSQLISKYPGGQYYKDRLYPVDPYNYDYFDTIVSEYGITDHELALLRKNKFVVTERLSYNNMVGPLDEIFHKDLPVFVTTDFILKAIHRSYDNILMDLERDVLEPNLKEILAAMRESFADLENKYGEISGLQTALGDVDIYTTIALSLLDSTTVEPYMESKVRVDTILQAIYDEKVIRDSLFSYRKRLLDFSQFKPRGHYTTPADPWFEKFSLSNYFRAMMWLGRMEFYLTPPPPEPGMDEWSKKEIRRMHLAAFMLQELLETSGAIDILLENDRMIEFLVGESDNLTPWEYGRIIGSIPGLVSAEQLLSDDVYDPYYEVVSSSLEAEQKILSGILYSQNPFDTIPEQLPVSYRTFGQRFVIDSYIFSNVVYDRIIYEGKSVWRGLPDPLDAMFVLGNNNAGELLKQELEEYHYSSQADALRYLVNEYDDEFWNNSLYNTWLQSIRDLNSYPEQPGIPYYMKTVAWQHQKLNTQLASWAQLRHDNLLYVKQSYTWGVICSYPHSFVEPYPEFYRSIAHFCDAAYSYFSENQASFSITNYFIRVRNIMLQLARIAEKELSLEPLNEDEITFLKGMMREPGHMCGEPPWAGWFIDLYYDVQKLIDEEDYVIADVHTQATTQGGSLIGRILHVGTGKVNLGIFLAGSPSDNYKPVAFVGPCMSYYEHTTINWDRKTDEWWENRIKSEFPPRPEWTHVYLADRYGNENEGGIRLTGNVYDGKDNTGINEIRPGLFCIHPNPVTDYALIQFSLNENTTVTLDIYDVMGRKTGEICNRHYAAGDHWIEWTPADLNPGIYYATMIVGNFKSVVKIIKQ